MTPRGPYAQRDPANPYYVPGCQNDYDWRVKAACRNHPNMDWWFPDARGISSLQQQTKAVEVCHQCPVEANCLLYALKFRIFEGVWGGTTEAQRAQLLKGAA